MALEIQKGGAESSLALTNPSSPLPSPGPSTTANSTAPALILSNSGKKMDHSGTKKYVKQVTGRHNDTELHLAAVRPILSEIVAQVEGPAGGEEFVAEVVEIRSAAVNEVNEVEETPLMMAAERGFLDVVVELFKYLDRESVSRKNKSGFDALHSAAKGGHREIVQVLLDRDPMILAKSLGPSNITPLIAAATTEVVKLLLDQDTSQIELSKSNGKNALHFAARQGHVEIVKALLEKDPQLARRTDKKGQTALQMAVMGTNSEVVKALVDADPAIVMLPDRAGNTALHVATRKKRSEIVNVLSSLLDIHVNALARDIKLPSTLPKVYLFLKNQLKLRNAYRATEL